MKKDRRQISSYERHEEELLEEIQKTGDVLVDMILRVASITIFKNKDTITRQIKNYPGEEISLTNDQLSSNGWNSYCILYGKQTGLFKLTNSSLGVQINIGLSKLSSLSRLVNPISGRVEVDVLGRHNKNNAEYFITSYISSGKRKVVSVDGDTKNDLDLIESIISRLR